MKKKATKAKGTKKKSAPRLLGIVKAGTTMGNILSELVDGKVHSLEALKECRVRPKDGVAWWLGLLKVSGKSAERPFKLEFRDVAGKRAVQLVFLSGAKPVAKSASHKKTAAAKPNGKPAVKAQPTNGKEHDDEENEAPAPARARVQDVPVED